MLGGFIGGVGGRLALFENRIYEFSLGCKSRKF